MICLNYHKPCYNKRIPNIPTSKENSKRENSMKTNKVYVRLYKRTKRVEINRHISEFVHSFFDASGE